MRYSVLFTLLFAVPSAIAQITITTPVEFTGPDGERTIDGIAEPISGDAAITVEGSVRSEWAWAEAAAQGNSIILTVDPDPTTYRDGFLVRFVAPATLHGTVILSVNGLPSLPLLRPDGLPLTVGQFMQGRVCEVMQANGIFHLLNARDTGCPPGFLAVNANYCIEAASTAATDWLTATDQCGNKGGQLCTWGEHHAACMALQGQFTDIFVDYEWVDDTSNHTHGANQVARVNCLQQRTRTLSVPARVRCCFHPR